MTTSESSAKPVLDAIADYVEARQRHADLTTDAARDELNEIGHRFFVAWQTLQAVFDNPYR